LEKQWLPQEFRGKGRKGLWKSRYEEINTFENALTEKNICIIKFYLHISREEQQQRFLARIDDPQKNWKFSLGDVREREFWDDYQAAYEDMLNATSSETAPWHVIPADKKWFARACVADIIAAKLESFNLKYPTLNDKQREELAAARRELEKEGSD
jgi:polyphosphate kinase 2 (PPK2 family)